MVAKKRINVTLSDWALAQLDLRGRRSAVIERVLKRYLYCLVCSKDSQEAKSFTVYPETFNRMYAWDEEERNMVERNRR